MTLERQSGQCLGKVVACLGKTAANGERCSLSLAKLTRHSLGATIGYTCQMYPPFTVSLFRYKCKTFFSIWLELAKFSLFPPSVAFQRNFGIYSFDLRL